MNTHTDPIQIPLDVVAYPEPNPTQEVTAMPTLTTYSIVPVESGFAVIDADGAVRKTYATQAAAKAAVTRLTATAISGKAAGTPTGFDDDAADIQEVMDVAQRADGTLPLAGSGVIDGYLTGRTLDIILVSMEHAFNFLGDSMRPDQFRKEINSWMPRPWVPVNPEDPNGKALPKWGPQVFDEPICLDTSGFVVYDESGYPTRIRQNDRQANEFFVIFTEVSKLDPWGRPSKFYRKPGVVDARGGNCVAIVVQAGDRDGWADMTPEKLRIQGLRWFTNPFAVEAERAELKSAIARALAQRLADEREQAGEPDFGAEPDADKPF